MLARKRQAKARAEPGARCAGCDDIARGARHNDVVNHERAAQEVRVAPAFPVGERDARARLRVAAPRGVRPERLKRAFDA
jgi:hypothetical protein